MTGPPGGSGTTPAIGRVIAVIPAWNADERLGNVLAALATQVAGVVVVDNGSADGTVASLAAAADGDGPPVELIVNAANRGYAAAVNQGVQRAVAGGADALLLVNDDALFQGGAVSALAAALAGDGRLAAATAHMVYRDQPGVLNGAGGRVDRAHGVAALRGAGEPDDGRHAGRPMVDYPSGAACLIRAEAWRAVGPLDEAWYLYYEDADWGLRAGERGWRCAYVPAAQVVHVGSAGTAADPARRRYYNVRNRLRFARRHCRWRGWLWAWGATAVLLARQPLRSLFPHRRRDAAAVAWGVWDHLRGRYGRSGRFG